MAKVRYNDHPLADCLKMVDEIRSKDPKANAYQKFTCEKCGSRQTIDEPNTFYTSGSCEECKHITDIAKRGCNYMMVFGDIKVATEVLNERGD